MGGYFVTVWQTVRGQQPQNVLDCNFDQQNFCRWTNGVNGVEDDFDWRIDNTAPIDGFHSIPRTVTGSETMERLHVSHSTLSFIGIKPTH